MTQAVNAKADMTDEVPQKAAQEPEEATPQQIKAYALQLQNRVRELEVAISQRDRLLDHLYDLATYGSPRSGAFRRMQQILAGVFPDRQREERDAQE